MPENVCAHFSELTSGSVKEVVEYDREHIDGHTVHSTRYRLPSKRESTALRLGGQYVRAERILSATDVDGGQKVYVVSKVYNVTDFKGANHLTVAQKRVTERLNELCQPFHPCMYLDLSVSVIFAELCNRHEWS